MRSAPMAATVRAGTAPPFEPGQFDDIGRRVPAGGTLTRRRCVADHPPGRIHHLHEAHRAAVVLRRDEDDDEPGRTARRPARAVQEILGVGWEVPLQHHRHVVDVDAAGCDIGADERLVAALAGASSARSRSSLAESTVDRGCFDAGSTELFHEPFGTGASP